MSNIKFLFGIFFFSSLFVFTSCNKDDEMTGHEEEVITTLTYTLTPDGGGDAVVFSFRDTDGDDGNVPVITAGDLAANTTYTGTLELLNETEDPVGNITEEVEEEGTDHQFFFSSTTNITVAYTDEDSAGQPIGLGSTLTTGDAGSGDFTIILRHEPAKDAENVREGDITNAGGETDIEVTFAVTIQ